MKSSHHPYLAPVPPYDQGNNVSTDDLLQNHAFDFDNPVPKPVTVLSLGGKPISTAGNITSVQGPPKAGKSAVISAVLGSFLKQGLEGDTLCFSSANPARKAVVHIDSEQSRYDHDTLVRLAMRRGSVKSSPPEWFHSYCLTAVRTLRRREAFFDAIEMSAQQHGGLHAVIIDGVADICVDPNDAKEAFSLIEEIQSAAVRHDCVIFAVLHENPGSDYGKTRGHLGSQLERKAETCLRVSKDDDGISTIWCDRGRHGDIPKIHGTCFRWSDAMGMHVHAGKAGELKAAKDAERFRSEAEASFERDETLGYSELVVRIMSTTNLKQRAAKNRVKMFEAHGVTRKEPSGQYVLVEGSSA